jgi:type III restriction enzyme
MRKRAFVPLRLDRGKGTEHLEYQPDFVAETQQAIYMLEPKAANQMIEPDVVAKRDVAIEWCRHATAHSASYQGKPWTYALIPHDVIAENMTINALVGQYSIRQ